MSKFDDSLRGYGHEIHQRDNFTCRFCGADGTKSFDTWLTLAVDHLLPKGYEKRENAEYKVTSCGFCNTVDNHYFSKAEARGLKFDNMSPEQLVAQRKEWVEKRRQEYRRFWENEVSAPPKPH